MIFWNNKNKKIKTAAEAILNSINSEIVDAALEAYQHIKTTSDEYDHDYEPSLKQAQDARVALNKLVSLNGDIKKFKKENPDLIQVLNDGHLAFNDVIHVLIDHHNDTKEAHDLYEHHPKLHQLIPKQYDDEQHVIEVLVEMVRDYQWQLEHFAIDFEAELKS